MKYVRLTNLSDRDFCRSPRSPSRLIRSSATPVSPASAHGFTMIELIVVIAIISILISLLLPAVQQARSSARRIHCQNNIRNVCMAVLQVTESSGRFPASAIYPIDNPTTGQFHEAHSWVVDVLPWLERNDIANLWNSDKPLQDPGNQALAQNHVPVLCCPDDISVVGQGDLSYVVNGGVGFTVISAQGVHDCPADSNGRPMDFNSNGVVCPVIPKTDGSPSDKDLFFKMGLFFIENGKGQPPTIRHYTIGQVEDGMSNTVLLSENVRTGVDPAQPNTNWAACSPYLTGFYIGNPCPNADCAQGKVDYSLANSGAGGINSGLSASEGSSPRPNSFHPGGVHFAFGDGHVKFVSQSIAGGVYAALVSPQGGRLSNTALRQPVASDLDY